MLLDIEGSPDEDEIAAVLEQQTGRIVFWRRRSILSGAIFLLLVGVNSLFLNGMTLHFLWERIGEYLLGITFGGMIWALYSLLLLWGAFSLHREFKKTYATREK